MIEIYTKPGCYACARVVEFLNDNKIKFEGKSIIDDANREFVVKKGKRMQVPFMYDVEKEIGMFESDDIILYLQKRFNVT